MKPDIEIIRLKAALQRAIEEREELRNALAIHIATPHAEAVEAARRTAYEAKTARLIEGHTTLVERFGRAVWVSGDAGETENPDLHLAVRSAAEKEVRS